MTPQSMSSRLKVALILFVGLVLVVSGWQLYRTLHEPRQRANQSSCTASTDAAPLGTISIDDAICSGTKR